MAVAESSSRSRSVRLAYRAPYDWEALLAFLALRATAGVECVAAGRYRRTVQSGAVAGVIEISSCEASACLLLDARGSDAHALPRIVERVTRMLDLGVDPAAVAAHLGADPLLRVPLLRHQGIRVPGAWDAFELAVRAVVGQQASVKSATTIAGRMAARWGTPVAGVAGLDRLFPPPAQLAEAPLETVGLMPSRAATIRNLARAVADGQIDIESPEGLQASRAGLLAIPGIGPWTADYVAMRALRDPDAFPSGDLVLRRMAGGLTARQLEVRAERWRPWRAYAATLLWQQASDVAAGMPPHRRAARGVPQ